MTDRHPRRGLPQIPLADLPRAINGPLVRARRQEQRADLTQVVIDDRLGAIEPERLDQLPDPDPRELRIILQQPMNLLLERVKLRRALRHTKHRRLLRAQRRPDRVPRQPVRRSSSLIDTPRTKCSRRNSAHCSTSNTTLLPVSVTATEPGSTRPRTPPPPPHGVNSQPAKRGQFLTGADGTAVPHRQAQAGASQQARRLLSAVHCGHLQRWSADTRIPKSKSVPTFALARRRVGRRVGHDLARRLEQHLNLWGCPVGEGG